jgi:hypothetical protein
MTSRMSGSSSITITLGLANAITSLVFALEKGTARRLGSLYEGTVKASSNFGLAQPSARAEHDLDPHGMGQKLRPAP